MEFSTSGRQEHIGYAFVRAVAYAAGYTCARPEIDEDSEDVTVAAKGGGRTLRSPKLSIQVKCTTAGQLTDDYLAYPVSLKNYNDLRYENYQVPRILVAATIPKDLSDWVTVLDEHLILKHCAYWVSLRGLPEETSADKSNPRVTVRISRVQRFDVAALKRLLNLVASGGKP